METAGNSGQHVFSMAPLGVWLRLIADNGGVPPRYWGKLAKVLAISALMTPLRVAERFRYGPSRMARVANGMPATRPMDNMAVSVELPQEEEIALANTSHLSFVHHLSFPNRAREYQEKYSTMRLTSSEMARWRRAYLDVLRKKQYMKDRDSIPEGHLAEVRFENLERAPMAELERLYDELALPGWERARQPIADYLGTLSGYRKNAYRIDPETIDIVDRNWGFAVEVWGYRPPNQGPT